MRLFSSMLTASPSSSKPNRNAGLLLLLAGSSLIPLINAVDIQSAPPSNLDFSGLGRVALAGYFDSISLYDYVGQDEDGLSPNGSQSILAQFPTGGFTGLQSSDAYIETMCSFVASDGTLNGVVVGGNFTSIGGQQVQAVALFDPVKNTVTPLPGLSGQVNAVYCDNPSGTVYVGGMFSGADSTNAIAWVNGWTNLPFAGFNGPVSSIEKLPNGNILFAGQFTGIGNMTMPHKADAQVINVGTASFTIGGQSTTPGFGSASNIICSTPGTAGPGTSFILEDSTPGYLQADFNFGFQPSKLRLSNSQVPGYATKTWRFTYLPEGGILNMTYYDENGLQSCTNECPMAHNASYQDFYFVNNQIGMNSFRIDISDWYGKGGGLAGLELFQNDIYSWAIEDFNEPHCNHLDNVASSSKTGSWQESQVGQSPLSQYLIAELDDGTVDDIDLSVTFTPNILQSGNYTIVMYTPGCVLDDTCANRGVVNVTGQLSSSTSSTAPSFSTLVYQNSNYDKFEPVFFGYVEANSDSFTPSVTLTPSPGQNGPLTVVAQRVQFELMSTTGGLNGLFEFEPNEATVNPNFQRSAMDVAGNNLNDGANILALAVGADDTTYAAGSFSSNSDHNIMSISDDKTASLSNGGLNDVVQALWYTDGKLYAGGNFSSTFDDKVRNLNNVASYDVSKKTWIPLGAGVNGIVYNIVPFSVNVTGHGTQDALGVSGYFSEINSFAKYTSHPVLNVAVWLPTLNNWLQNVDSSAIAITGQLNAYTSIPGMQPIWSGGVDSQMLAASNVAGLTGSQAVQLQSLPVTFQAASGSSPSTRRKRATNTGSVEGIVTGLFYNQNNRDLTVLGGHFTANATNGDTVTNLMVIDGSNNDRILGVDFGSSSNADAAILALDTQGTSLFAGGSINSGLIVYDLSRGDLTSSQPPPLSGRQATVNAIATKPQTSDVYVGGSFTSAGSLSCPALCVYDANVQQWNSPGTGLSSSSTINVLEWTSTGDLILAGDLMIRGKRTTMATYNPKKETFTIVDMANSLPGPITAYSAVDSSYTSAFVSGTASTNGSLYLAMFDGSNTWTMIKGIGAGSKIEGLQVLSVSSDHDSSDLMNPNQVLLVTGALQLSRFGDVSAVLYDGSSFMPFAFSTLSDGSPASISRLFVENSGNLLIAQESYLALGFIVLIGLACALGAVFLIVVLGIFVERIRRRREGYVPAPTGAMMFEKSEGGKVGKIEPEQLFQGIGDGGGGTAGSRL